MCGNNNNNNNINRHAGTLKNTLLMRYMSCNNRSVVAAPAGSRTRVQQALDATSHQPWPWSYPGEPIVESGGNALKTGRVTVALLCQTFYFLVFSPCSADHERNCPPCKKVFFPGGNQYAEFEKQTGPPRSMLLGTVETRSVNVKKTTTMRGICVS